LNGFNLPQIQAEEKRHHKAHVHGIAHLNIALEGNELYVEFTSPAVNIVGFEHQPKTEKEKHAVKEAIETLKAGEKLFIMPPRAGATLTEASVESEIDYESKDSHGHDEDARHHDDEKHDKEHHDEHKHGEEHHDEDEHDVHSEFKAVYRFACKNPGKLTHVDVMLFQMYKGIEHIEVQLLTPTQQTGLELTGDKSRISF
jgi:hypothetical protein